MIITLGGRPPSRTDPSSPAAAPGSSLYGDFVMTDHHSSTGVQSNSTERITVPGPGRSHVLLRFEESEVKAEIAQLIETDGTVTMLTIDALIWLGLHLGVSGTDLRGAIIAVRSARASIARPRSRSPSRSWAAATRALPARDGETAGATMGAAAIAATDRNFAFMEIIRESRKGPSRRALS